MEVEISRLLSSRARIQDALKRRGDSGNRRARTRTLIQIGGLVSLSGLLPICQIEEGEDLQFDIDSRDKAAALLGILLEAAGNIFTPPDAGLWECWRESGTRLLKQRTAQRVYQKPSGPGRS